MSVEHQKHTEGLLMFGSGSDSDSRPLPEVHVVLTAAWSQSGLRRAYSPV